MLFKSKKSNKTMLQYATLTGTVTGPSEITVDGKTYTLYTTPLHLAHESKPLDVSAQMGKTIKVSGGTGATAIYEAKIVE
ncbi:MAG: hypothetical protein HY774_22115 [Acidobacteria bacterium]|nr:hypothetical protein [Acidobacteriota bacterium]